MSKRLTKEEFIAKAQKVHCERYDYSKVEYKGNKIPICIVCHTHGEFWQTPHNHLHGQNCPHCAIKNKTSNTNIFIAKARAIHGDRYGYSKVEYVNSKTKVRIACPIHGDFLQRPDLHLSGSICPKCSNDNRMNSLEFYIELSKKKHGDKYDFSHAVYLGSRHNIEIHCKECGNIFYRTPQNLIRGNGCRMCRVEGDRRTECFEGELWKDINDFDGYQISNMGRIRSVDRTVAVGVHKKEIVGLILKTNKDRDGYECVNLKVCGKSYRKKIHRLMAEAFIDNPNNYPCIDHINGIRDDNRVENLRWCTNKMNVNYELAKKNRSEAIRQSYINYPNLRVIRAKTFRKSKMKRVEVIKNGESLGIFESQRDAASVLGITESIISSLVLNRNKTINGIIVKRV